MTIWRTYRSFAFGLLNFQLELRDGSVWRIRYRILFVPIYCCDLKYAERVREALRYS